MDRTRLIDVQAHVVTDADVAVGRAADVAHRPSETWRDLTTRNARRLLDGAGR